MAIDPQPAEASLTLGALLTRIMPTAAQRAFVMAAAVLLTVLVGVSRVYLGVHWPSDVLAGLCAGFAWAMLFWLAARFVSRWPARSHPAGPPDWSEMKQL